MYALMLCLICQSPAESLSTMWTPAALQPGPVLTHCMLSIKSVPQLAAQLLVNVCMADARSHPWHLLQVTVVAALQGW